jgi:outer membrane biosynthesis protein TonB
MMRKSILLLLCLGLLSACERAPEPVAQQPAPEPAVVAAPEPAPVAEVAKPKPVEPAPPAKVVENKPVPPAKPPVAAKPKPAAAPQTKPAEPESKLALDLSVPQELFEQALESETRDELSPLLPPMFGEKPEAESPFQISGRLISNERVDDYWDSIEGAEVQFEFKR